MPVPRLGAGRAFSRALRACAEHGGMVAFTVLFFSAFGLPVHFVAKWLDLPTGTQDQSTLMKLMFSQLAVDLTQETFVGPLFGALAVYVGMRSSMGQPGELYGGINFALSRFGRLVGWYFVVTLCVQIGLGLVVVPGILFYLMYAFVVPVLCMEDEKWPLARSKKLTVGRRRAIFLLFLPAVIGVEALSILDFVGAIQSWLSTLLGTKEVSDAALALAWFVIESLRMGYQFVMMVAIFFLYEDRVTRGKAAEASRAAVG